ncbi:MAG TPA: DUF4012 domain-containing protein [Ktedonobacterales bacterium]|nr:DUF4012 domain-containing protein [Ktedonobacterales bacterium]
MDDQNPPSQPRRGLLSGRYHEASDQTSDQVNGAAAPSASRPHSGGLLSRFAASSGPLDSSTPAGVVESAGAAGAPAASQEHGWRRVAGGARRLGENLRRLTDQPDRKPGARDWRATDFATGDLDDWDVHGEMPFEMPPDPDGPEARNGRDGSDRRDGGARGARSERRRDRNGRHDDERDSYRDDGRGRRASSRRDGSWDGWEEEQDGAWETGSWDTAWAADDEPLDPYPPERRGGGRSRRRREHAVREERNVVGDLRMALDDDALAASLDTLAQLGAVTRPLSRVSRVRLLMQRRPAAAAMLAFFLLGFMLSCCAPLIPLARLGYDTIDLARHVSHLKAMAAGGTAQLINGSKLTEAQADIAAIEGDLYEINGAVAIAGAPLGAVSPTMRNYQLLVRIGYDLTGAANESIQVAQSLLTPLEGGALSSDSTTPGITPADIQQARVLLADADARTLDAVAAYHQLDQNALPAQLKPGTQYGKMLAMLPLAEQVFGELKNLIDAAPALLGVGQPAYYLAIAMDRSELRPGGGFQGNYGILELDGGKQSKSAPFGLKNTYVLDQQYAQKFGAITADCGHPVTDVPNSAWWWPVRCVNVYGWGLRDSNLSPDFPTNARAAIQIAQGAGETPNGAPIQGVVAFTPGLIEDILNATGPLPMPEYNITVTASNLEQTIHKYQLSTPTAQGQDRKQFTHDLASQLLARIKSMHGSGLKTIFSIAEQAIVSKDLQVYLSDPRAELILQQLGLSSTINTGGGDGFFVVDTNDGGNKANLYVSETQTDLVTLLPNGGAYHRLAISVTYNKQGYIYNPGSDTPFNSYSDVQRTYLPGDATITGWAGFTPSIFGPSACQGTNYATIISDCSQAHGIYGVSTNSDTPGRTMVMGNLLVLCGSTQQGDWGAYNAIQESSDCGSNPQPHTETIFLSWYTPHAYTVDASGHGTYSELVEKQAGDQPNLTVYVTRGNLTGPQQITDLDTFNGLTAKAQKVYSGPLAKNTLVSYNF